MDLGKNIRKLREERGLSRGALGRITGLASHSIYKIESGRRPTPHLDTLDKIASGLDVPVAEFFAEEPATAPKESAPSPRRPEGKEVEPPVQDLVNRVVAQRLAAVESSDHALGVLRAVERFAIDRRQAWADAVRLYKEHGLGLAPLFEDIRASLVMHSEFFWAGLEVLLADAPERGLSATITQWPDQHRKEVFRTLAALRLLNAFYGQLRRKALSPDADPADIRAIQGEFIDAPPEWKRDPVWPEAVSEARELVGVGT